MTCIIGYLDSQRGYIGADSAGVAGYETHPRKDPKVFKIGGVLMGFTSSFRMGQLLNFNLKVPKKADNEKAYMWMVKRFIPAVRECFKDGGYLLKKDEREGGGTFIVIAHCHLFCVESDFQVAEYHWPFYAVGCGAQYALGSLITSMDATGVTTRQRITKALRAASEFSGAVCPPFNVLSVRR